MEIISHLLFFMAALSAFWLLVRAPGNLVTRFLNLFKKKKTDDYLDEIKEEPNPQLDTFIGLVIWLTLMYFGVQMLPQEEISEKLANGIETKIEKEQEKVIDSEAYKQLEESSRLLKKAI